MQVRAFERYIPLTIFKKNSWMDFVDTVLPYFKWTLVLLIILL